MERSHWQSSGESFQSLNFLVQLKRAKLPSNDLVLLYTTCIRSILSYAVPVIYYALPKYLQNDLERVQKRALSIIFPGLAYNKALEVAGIQTISDYNESICDKTFKYISNNTSLRLRSIAVQQFQLLQLHLHLKPSLKCS